MLLSDDDEDDDDEVGGVVGERITTGTRLDFSLPHVDDEDDDDDEEGIKMLLFPLDLVGRVEVLVRLSDNVEEFVDDSRIP